MESNVSFRPSRDAKEERLETVVQGTVAPGFSPVADAFAATVSADAGAGAACTVLIGGKTVVDIYAGVVRGNEPWTASTRAVGFSVSKAVTAICLVMAADQGFLDLDEPVAAYWPEFGQHGKGNVTTRQVLAHRAGLPALEQPVKADDLKRWIPVVEALAEQHPLWEPNRSFMYHAVTVGFIAGEVLRRTTGKSPSQWLADHIAGPLGLGMTFGADAADRDLAPVLPPAFTPGAVLPEEELALAIKVMMMDSVYSPDIFRAANEDALLAAESPAVNIVSTARDLARLMSATVVSTDGVRLLSPGAVQEAIVPQSFGKPFIGPDRGDIWGTGFMLHSSRRAMAGQGSFGHDGAAGQIAFAHPGHGLGFGYQTIKPGGDDDTRAEVLSAALRRCL